MKKTDDAPVEREENDLDHKEARVYELGFHIDAELSTDEVQKVYQGLRSTISAKGTVLAEGEPQKLQLAYTISRTETTGRRDFDTSYFAWIAYEIDGAGHANVLEAIKNDTRVFRFLDIRTTKEAAEHSAQMHEIMLKSASVKEEEEESEEEVSDEEIDQALKEVGV